MLYCKGRKNQGYSNTANDIEKYEILPIWLYYVND